MISSTTSRLVEPSCFSTERPGHARLAVDVISVSHPNPTTTKYVSYATFSHRFICVYTQYPRLGRLAAHQSRLVVKQSGEESAKLAAKPYRHCFFGRRSRSPHCFTDTSADSSKACDISDVPFLRSAFPTLASSHAEAQTAAHPSSTADRPRGLPLSLRRAPNLMLNCFDSPTPCTTPSSPASLPSCSPRLSAPGGHHVLVSWVGVSPNTPHGVILGGRFSLRDPHRFRIFRVPTLAGSDLPRHSAFGSAPTHGAGASCARRTFVTLLLPPSALTRQE